jgi:hypothetical protein
MMRFPSWLLGAYLVLSATLAAAAEPSADDILKLEGEKLFDAAKDVWPNAAERFTATDLIRITQKLASSQDKSPERDTIEIVLSGFLEAACSKAGPKELDDLVRIYIGFEPDSFEKQFNLREVAAVWIKVELESAGREFQKINLPPPTAPVPAELVDAPPDLIAAWKIYKAADQVIDQGFPWNSDSRNISFQGNSRAFFKIIDDVLLKRGKGLAEHLEKFGWNGPSGTGSELLSEPKSLGIFMALIHERRIEEAVGAAVRVCSAKPLAAGDTDVRIEFWRRCGLDWEALLAGMQVDRELGGSELATWQNPSLRELAGYGSDHAAALITMMARRAKPAMRATYANAISAFIPRDGDDKARFDYGVFERVSKIPISKDTQLALVAVLQDFAKPDASREVALATLDGFSRAKLPITSATLRALTKHPSAEVARQATDVLRAMGGNVAFPAVPAEKPPVRFRIFANGQPLAPDCHIQLDLNFGTGGSVTSSTNIEADGTVGIDRKYFAGEQGQVSSLALMSRPYDTADGPSFLIKFPPPADLDSITRVDVDLCVLQLDIRDIPGKDGARDRKASINIERHEDKSEASVIKERQGEEDITPIVYEYSDPLTRKFETPIDQPVRVSMQCGSYDLVVRAPGTTQFTKQVEVDKNMPPLEVQLEKGSDVHFQVARPDGERHARLRLLKEGRKVDLEKCLDVRTMTFRNMPPGNYVLHFPSSAEVKSQDAEFGYAPARIEYAEREIPFTLKEDSPPVIDLGTINLEPAAK